MQLLKGQKYQSDTKRKRMIHEFRNPIPVVTPLGDGYAIYVTSSGTLEDDCWAVALRDGGNVKHFLSRDICIWANGTFGIRKQPTS
jgi:hypothetical protein